MENIREWIKFGVWGITTLVAVLVLVWRLITKPMLDQLNGYGERVKKVESKITELEQHVVHVDRDHERLEMQHMSAGERMGRIEGSYIGLNTTLESMRREMSENNTQIRERLSHMEAKMDVGTDLKEAIGDFAELVEKTLRTLKP